MVTLNDGTQLCLYYHDTKDTKDQRYKTIECYSVRELLERSKNERYYIAKYEQNQWCRIFDLWSDVYQKVAVKHIRNEWSQVCVLPWGEVLIGYFETGEDYPATYITASLSSWDKYVERVLGPK